MLSIAIAGFTAIAAPFTVSGRVPSLAESGNAVHAVFTLRAPAEGTKEAPFVCLDLPGDWSIRRAFWAIELHGRRMKQGDAELLDEVAPGPEWSCVGAPARKYKTGSAGHLAVRIHVPRSSEGQQEIRFLTPSGSTVTRTMETRRGLGIAGRSLPIPAALEEDPATLDRILKAVSDVDALLDRVDALADHEDVPGETALLLALIEGAEAAFDETTAGVTADLSFYTALSDHRLGRAETLLSEELATWTTATLDESESLLERLESPASVNRADHLLKSVYALDETSDEALTEELRDRALDLGIVSATRRDDAEALEDRTARCFQQCEDSSVLGRAYLARVELDAERGDQDQAAAWCRSGRKRIEGSQAEPKLTLACDALVPGWSDR